ncbi:MAG: archease [Bacillota bacterium]
MGSYTFIDHTADIAVLIKGSTIEELFINAALAWKESVSETITQDTVEQGETVERGEVEQNILHEKIISITETSREELLVSFLSELNFLISAKKWIFNSVKDIKILSVEKKDEFTLNALIAGEEFNPLRYKLKEEIKAVTFHQMKITFDNKEFSTIVVFDI